MRTIPVTVNGNHMKVVGQLQLDDDISDEEFISCSITWAIDSRDKKLLELTLIPPLVIPRLSRDEDFKNWLTFWMEGNLPWQPNDLVNKLYQDLVAAQYKIEKVSVCPDHGCRTED